MSRTRPARLRTWVIFQNQVRVTDAGGGATFNYGLAWQGWAQMLPPSARETFANEKLRSDVDIIFKLRKNRVVKTDMRVRLNDGRVLQAKTVYDAGDTNDWTFAACVWLEGATG